MYSQISSQNIPPNTRAFHPAYPTAAFNGQTFNPLMWGCEPGPVGTDIYDFSQFCEHPSYNQHIAANPPNPQDENDLDFANFPWLPDFEQQYNSSNYQSLQFGANNNPVGHSFHSNSSGMTTGSSDSGNSDLSGGEVETAKSSKNPKRKLSEMDQSEVKSTGDALIDGESVVDRRERNRLNAKKARLRKKQLLGSLQGQLSILKGENAKLRRVIAARIPEKAMVILNKSQRFAEILAAHTP